MKRSWPLTLLALVPLIAGTAAEPGSAATGPGKTATSPAPAIASPAPVSGSAFPVLTDVTAASGIDYVNVCGAPPEKKGWMTETIGAGAAWLDYDADGSLDLYIVNGSTHERPAGQGEPNRLFRGDGAGRFTDVTAKAGVGDRGWGYGVAVGDIDNDGDPDIYVTNLGPDTLYLNGGDGTFADITMKAGISDSLWGSSAAFFDMDGDGDLDLYVCEYVDFDPSRIPRRGSREALRPTCTYRGIEVYCGPMSLPPAQDILYRNNGNGTFTDVTKAAGVWLEKPRYGLGVVTGDFDNDGLTDLYVANDGVQNSLWRNRGDGTFEDVGLVTLSGLNAEGEAQAGMGTDFGDVDGDGWLDLVVTNFSEDMNSIYRNLAGKMFADQSQPSGMMPTYMALSWGTGFYDFDLDGDLDLFIANGHVYPEVDGFEIGTRFRQKNHLFVNDGGRFALTPAPEGSALALERSFRGAAFADYDEDGDMDIFVTALGEAGQLLRNDTPRRSHYLRVSLTGSVANRDAIGARVTVTAGGRRMIQERRGGGSYLSYSDGRLLFGLGESPGAESVEIRWPDGSRQTMSDVPGDRTLHITQPLPDETGSAPAPETDGTGKTAQPVQPPNNG